MIKSAKPQREGETDRESDTETDRQTEDKKGHGQRHKFRKVEREL